MYSHPVQKFCVRFFFPITPSGPKLLEIQEGGKTGNVSLNWPYKKVLLFVVIQSNYEKSSIVTNLTSKFSEEVIGHGSFGESLFEVGVF